MSKRMYPVIHFEMPAEDRGRVKKFYESVFGWQITEMGPEMGDFSLAFTTETDPVSRMPRKAGAINGGFYPKTEPGQQAKLTILVDDLDAVLKNVTTSGGRSLGEPFDLEGVGRFATFLDTEGNTVTLYEDRSPNPTPEQRALLLI